MMIYKIFRARDWAEFEAGQAWAGAPVDLADGFIHFSTAETVAETAAKHFAGETGLTLGVFDPERLGAALVWEPSRGGALFPHLYRPVARAECLRAAPLPLGPEGHLFEGLLA